MNKNTVKKLADNPYYSMNDKELEALSELLHEEAEVEKREESKISKIKINKNKVKKNFVKLEKTPAIEEVDENEPTK